MSRDCGLAGPLREKRFENFELYARNSTALEMARKFAAEPSRKWLWIPGDNGTGKTHLLAAICNELVTRGVPVLYAYVPKLLQWLRQGFRTQQQASMWGENEAEAEHFDQRFRRILEVDVLLLDDLGAQQDSPWVKEQLETVFDHRYVNQLPMAITTNDSDAELRDFSARIHSRVERYEGTAKVPVQAPPYHKRLHVIGGR